MGRFHLPDLSTCVLTSFGNLPLFVAGVKDGRTVLRANVIFLLIENGRVVHAEKETEQLFITQLGRIENDLDRLRVTGGMGANHLISWIWHGATGVTDGRFDDAGDLTESFLHPPKAAAC